MANEQWSNLAEAVAEQEERLAQIEDDLRSLVRGQSEILDTIIWLRDQMGEIEVERRDNARGGATEHALLCLRQDLLDVLDMIDAKLDGLPGLNDADRIHAATLSALHDLSAKVDDLEARHKEDIGDILTEMGLQHEQLMEHIDARCETEGPQEGREFKMLDTVQDPSPAG